MFLSTATNFIAAAALSPSNNKNILPPDQCPLLDLKLKGYSGPFVPVLFFVCPSFFSQKEIVKLLERDAQSLGFEYFTNFLASPFIALPLIPSVVVKGLSAGKVALMLSTAFINTLEDVPSKAA